MAIIITGDGFNNTLIAATSANHLLNGLAGADTLFGNAGNDTLDGGTGNDSMTGGAGNDTYVVDAAGDIVVEAAGGGVDLVQSSVSFTLGANVENLTLTGASSISGYGNTLANVIVGNGGNNYINGGAGADQMRGGLGSDTYVVDNAGDSVVELAGQGDDWVYSSITYTLPAEVENLVLTGAAAINGTGNALANRLYGNGADNVLNGLGGSDSMYGGGGNDTYYVDQSTDIADEAAGAGTDKVISSASAYTLDDQVENIKLAEQVILQTPFGSILVADGGRDATGNALANLMEGNALANRLYAMDGNDLIYGYGGNDTIEGGNGNDVMDGGTGSDSMTGGAGADSYYVDSAGDTVVEAALGGYDAVYSTVTHTLAAEVESLSLLGTASIHATGNALANSLYGNSGANTLDGKAGADYMAGGAGSDTYYVDSGADTVVEGANAGTDWVLSSVSFTLADPDVENLTLSGAAATNGTGNASANWMYGNGANNQLFGMGGNDYLWGSGGNDVIQGGTGADTLAGSTGNDVLRAVDNVFGVNDGVEDRFVFETTLNAATNVDLIDIASFGAGLEGADDEIVLENAIFTALLSTAGTGTGQLGAGYYFEGAGFSGAGQFDAAGIYVNTTNGQIFYNPTFGTAGDSVLFAVANVAGIAGGAAALSSEEFTLV